MHAVFVACLFGGAMATALFAILGFAGGSAGHGAHAHLGGGHGGHAPGVQSAHAAAHGHGHAMPHSQGAAEAHHALAHGSHGQRLNAGSTAVTGTHGAIAHESSPQSGSSTLGSVTGWVVSWLSPLTVAAAALWFGGAGLLGESVVGRLAVVIAVLAAVAGAAVVRATMSALVRASTPPLQLTAEGALATVNASIRPGVVGEVIYTLEGLHRSLPARSEENTVLPRGTAVVITRCERGMAWVSPLDPLQEMQSDVGESAETAQRPSTARDISREKTIDTNA